MRKFLKDCRSFLLLMIGFSVSKIGSAIYDVVIMWWLAKTTGNAKMSSFVLAAGVIPKIVIGFLACGFIDKIHKKTMMVITDIISGVVSIITGIMAYNNYVDINILIICTVVLSICSTLFNPSIKSLFPNMVKECYLLKCNSMHIAIRDISKIVGPLIGGAFLMIDGFPIGWIFTINGLSFIASAILEGTLDTKESKIDNHRKVIALAEIFDGFKYVWKKQEIRYIMMLCLLTNIFLASINVLLPTYILYVIEGSEMIYTIVLSCQIAGSLLLSLILMMKKDIKNKNNCMYMCIGLVGIAMCMLYFPNPIICCVMFIIFGAALALFSSLNSALLQMKTEREYLGRVSTLNLTLALSATPLGALLFGQVNNQYISTAFILSGLAIILCTILIYFISKKCSISK